MKIILSLIFVAIISWICYYFCMPTFAYGFVGLYLVLIIAGIIVGVCNIDDGDVEPVGIGGFVFSGLVLVGLALGSFFSTAPIINAASYQKLIGTVKEQTVTSDIEPINPENIVIIDEETAEQLADKKLLSGEDKALGSQAEIGPLTFQKVGDKMYYVAPLLHTGYFKWRVNSEGTPGYIMVNATDVKDVKLVQEVNGKKIHIKYQPGACFGDNLERYIYMNGYSGRGFTDYSFEIDDEGNPFYVVTLYDKTIGFAGSNATGVLIVDVQTGKMTEYPIDQTPAWVDRIHPDDFVLEQIDDWGYYVNGWLNPSDKDRLKPTRGISLVYGADGQCYFYCGLTSVGRDNSTIGFMMINSRTKSVTYYKQSGATEKAAMASAEGKVQEKSYRATSPRPYNVDGEWTYVMALKDKEGLIKMVAMVSVKDYSIVGVGETIRDALRSYKAAVNGTGNSMVTEVKDGDVILNGYVRNLSTDVKKGDTYYYFMLDTLRGNDLGDKGLLNKVFVTSSYVSEKIPLTRDMDWVKIDYTITDESFIDLVAFENPRIKLEKSVKQVKVEKYFKAVNDSIKGGQVSKDAKVKWDNLSAEDKLKLMKQAEKK